MQITIRSWARANGVPDNVPLNHCRRFLIYRTATVLGLLCCLLFMSRAHSAEWESVEPQCVEKIEQRYHCTTACVNRTWPEVARCTNAKLNQPIPQNTFEWCIQTVDDARKAAHTAELRGDPIRDAFACAGR